MDSLNLKICLFNVLITGESTFDEKSVPTAQSFIRKKVTSYKICILVNTIFFVSKIVTFFVFPCSIGYSDSLPRYYLNGLNVIFDQWQKLHLGLDALSNQKILKGI